MENRVKISDCHLTESMHNVNKMRNIEGYYLVIVMQMNQKNVMFGELSN